MKFTLAIMLVAIGMAASASKTYQQPLHGHAPTAKKNADITEDDLVDNGLLYEETPAPTVMPTIDSNLNSMILIIQSNPDEKVLLSPQHPDSFYAEEDPYEHQERTYNKQYFFWAGIVALVAVLYWIGRRGSLDDYLPKLLLDCIKSKADQENGWMTTPSSASSVVRQDTVVSL
jgi:hypothetical protein